jgi:hypothetical protein
MNYQELCKMLTWPYSLVNLKSLQFWWNNDCRLAPFFTYPMRYIEPLEFRDLGVN